MSITIAAKIEIYVGLEIITDFCQTIKLYSHFSLTLRIFLNNIMEVPFFKFLNNTYYSLRAQTRMRFIAKSNPLAVF